MKRRLRRWWLHLKWTDDVGWYCPPDGEDPEYDAAEVVRAATAAAGPGGADPKETRE